MSERTDFHQNSVRAEKITVEEAKLASSQPEELERDLTLGEA